jgi:hypothetical protein
MVFYRVELELAGAGMEQHYPTDFNVSLAISRTREDCEVATCVGPIHVLVFTGLRRPALERLE